jgi:hypothetical protein
MFSKHPIQDYTVGWVCALPIELAAATVMLDEKYQSLPHDDKDPCLYTLGRIGEHNVVLACLPAGQIGTNSAAVVATRMQSKFPSLRIGLMVGIGGGGQAWKQTFDSEMSLSANRTQHMESQIAERKWPSDRLFGSQQSLEWHLNSPRHNFEMRLVL